MKPGSCLVQEVETSTTPGSATAAAKRCSKASARAAPSSRPGCPDQRDPVGVDIGPGRHGVDHRRQHRLPVVLERDPLQEQAGLLAGAVEGHGVVAALVRRPAVVSW
jgi:hypothetical protein